MILYIMWNHYKWLVQWNKLCRDIVYEKKWVRRKKATDKMYGTQWKGTKWFWGKMKGDEVNGTKWTWDEMIGRRKAEAWRKTAGGELFFPLLIESPTLIWHSLSHPNSIPSIGFVDLLLLFCAGYVYHILGGKKNPELFGFVSSCEPMRFEHCW